MPNQISAILRKESNQYEALSSETIVKYNTKENKVIPESTNVLVPYLMGNIQYFVFDRNKSANIKIEFNWGNILSQELFLCIQIQLQVDLTYSERILSALDLNQDLTTAFRQKVLDLSEEYCQSKLVEGIDFVTEYFAKVNSNETVKDEFRRFLQNGIEDQVGFTVRNILISELVEDENVLKNIEIKTVSEGEILELKLSDFADSLCCNYEVVLGLSDDETRIFALFKSNQNKSIRSIVEQEIKDYAMSNVSLSNMINDKRGVLESIRESLNNRLKELGRIVVFFNIEVINSEVIELIEIPLIDFFVSIPIANIRRKGLSIKSIVAIEVSDYVMFRESGIKNVNSLVRRTLTNILEKEIITFTQFKYLLIDNLARKDFQKNVEKELNVQFKTKGLEVITIECVFQDTIEITNEHEPLNYKVECNVNGSPNSIQFGYKISISLLDKEKFIRNIPFEHYSVADNYFKEWLRSELNVIIKRIIEFRDYRTIVLESAKYLHFTTQPERSENYKTLIYRAVKEKINLIGCKVSQLLIEPELTPLSWLEERMTRFKGNYYTYHGRIPINIETTISYKIQSLENLSYELIRPNIDIEKKIENLVQKTITETLASTSSKRAYMEFYEGNDDNDISVEDELKRNIENALKSKFDTKVSFIRLLPLVNEFMEDFIALRNREKDIEFEVQNKYSSMKYTYLATFEVTGISDWNKYKNKKRKYNVMLDSIAKSIKRILTIGLSGINAMEAVMQNIVVREKLESDANKEIKYEIADRFGLWIRMFDLRRQITDIDKLQFDRTKKVLKHQVALDSKTQIKLLERKQRQINDLINQQEILEERVRIDIANEEDYINLRKIKTKLNNWFQQQNLHLIDPMNTSIGAIEVNISLGEEE